MDSQKIWLVRFDQHLNSEKRYSANTCEAYQRDLTDFLSYCQINKLKNWPEITSSNIRQFISQRHRQGLSGRSLQRVLSSIRQFFKFLIREKMVEENPAADISAPKFPKKLP